MGHKVYHRDITITAASEEYLNEVLASPQTAAEPAAESSVVANESRPLLANNHEETLLSAKTQMASIASGDSRSFLPKNQLPLTSRDSRIGPVVLGTLFPSAHSPGTVASPVRVSLPLDATLPSLRTVGRGKNSVPVHAGCPWREEPKRSFLSRLYNRIASRPVRFKTVDPYSRIECIQIEAGDVTIILDRDSSNNSFKVTLAAHSSSETFAPHTFTIPEVYRINVRYGHRGGDHQL